MEGNNVMKSGFWFVFLFALGLHAAEEEFVPLFNDTDLSGWVVVNCAPNTFTARDGMIVCTGKPTGVMRTQRIYENFILELDWKHVHPGGNAGLFVYSDALTAPGVPFTRAIEVQILDGSSPEGIWTGHGDVFAIHGATFVPDRPHPKGWMRCLPHRGQSRLSKPKLVHADQEKVNVRPFPATCASTIPAPSMTS